MRSAQDWKMHAKCSMQILAIYSVLLLSVINHAWAEDPSYNPRAFDLIQHLQDEFPSIRKTISEIDVAPVSSFFSRDKESYEEELNDYLDDALSLLLPDMYGNIREDLQEIDTDIELLLEKKSKMDAEEAFGQTTTDATSEVETAVRSVLGNDVSEFLFGESIESRISELEGRRNRLIEHFRDEMRNQFGLTLSVHDSESLLYQVNGGDLVESISVASILTDVEAHIREIVMTPDETFSKQVRRQYYGLALVVRLIIERLTQKHLDNYDWKYLPALVELESENARIRGDNVRILDEVTDRDKSRIILEQNIRSLDMAKKAIDYYRRMLMERREKVSRMLSEARREALVARSTLMTLEHVMNVGHVASKAFEEFASLSQLSAPDLLALDDQQLYEEFLDISRSLSVRIES